ncbi:extracellular calcium-sensing receptor-like isoform X2 [Hyperolius riggenbachi]
MLALLFATKEVNENPDLLPNITLGFQMYDSCFSEAFSLRATIQVTSGIRNPIPNYHCGPGPLVPAVIGDMSTSSMVIARLLGLWRIPQVSYIAVHPSLSNKAEFPSFLRTMISSGSQPQGLIELCKKFGWTWIGLIVSSYDYMLQEAIALKREAITNGICISFFETISQFGPGDKSMSTLVANVYKSTAKVVILYCSSPAISMLFAEVLQENLSGKVWIGIESWYTSPVTQYKQLWKIMNGTIGIARTKKVPPNFSYFLRTLLPSTYPRMLSFWKFWERMFNCKQPINNANNSISISEGGSQVCTGSEKLVTDDITEVNDPTLQAVYMAHNAIYAVVHALHNLLSCTPGGEEKQRKLCADKQNIKPWQVLYYLKRVKFVNTAGEVVSFTASGDINGYFDILNWHVKGDTGEYVTAGIFKVSVNASEKLFINESAIFWPGGQGKVPSSVCSKSCLPGYWKAPQRGQPVCCFDCILCPDGMISNQTNSIACFLCPEDQWPNNRRTRCIPKVIEFLTYEEPLGLVIISFSISFFVITVMVLCTFLKFRDTVVVKANNRSLSYLLLLSLKLCFLCSLMFIGRPTTLTCAIRQLLFAGTFSFCISCILAKTIIVVLAFKATKPGSNLRVWLSFKTAILIIAIANSIQLVIILVWLFSFPPFLERDFHILVGTILLECNEGLVVMFYCTIGYLGVLASISFFVAFLARNLPDSFNEAKYITFSMLTFLSVWSTFIPAYLSTKGKYIVAVEIFAILLSSFGLLSCIFAPKCYIILLKPSMNTKEYLASKAK